MQYIFKNWTSGNNDHIDKFIKDTQLSAHTFTFNALEWISYDKFYDIKFIAKENVTFEFINEISAHNKLKVGRSECHLNKFIL
ncbi:hypothetical protein RhiirB3_447231 [Rhizophagus irregularis]|nr:hypothetical protein RhiirB3_447231 [Rhizophagus irregularis]